MEQKIYFLDNASTTKMNPEAIEKVKCYLDKKYYNPSAVYECSVEVRKKISEARDYIFDSLGADLGQLIFTGSATEANNMAIFSNANLKKRMLFWSAQKSSKIEDIKLNLCHSIKAGVLTKMRIKICLAMMLGSSQFNTLAMKLAQ